MSLSESERDIIVKLELERAENILQEIPVYVNNQLWNTLTNRLYYAVFHATSALLIQSGFSPRTHQGVYVLLSQNFIKTNILTDDEGRLFARLETMREKGDYNCFLDMSSEDIMPLIEPSKQYIEHIKRLVEK